MQKGVREQWNGGKMAKNKLVEIFRFLFCMIVLMVHTHGLRPVSNTDYPFAGGYIVVEFFLILSGFFASNYAMNQTNDCTPAKSAIHYTWKQYLKICPIAAVCIVIQYIVTVCFHRLSLQDFPYIVYEILLLPQTGIYKTFLNLPLWYVSAYFICLPILIFLLRKSKDFFYLIGSIIVPLLVYGFICRTNIDLDIWSFTSNIWFIGLFRTFAGLCIGVCSYRIFCWIESTQFTEIGHRVVKAMAIIGLMGVVAYMYWFSFTYADYFLVFLMMFILAYINTIDIKSSKLDRVWFCLGDFSIYVYCSHWFIRDIVPRIMENSTYEQMLPIYLISAILYAIFIKIVVSYVKRFFGSIWRSVHYDSKV